MSFSFVEAPAGVKAADEANNCRCKFETSKPSAHLLFNMGQKKTCRQPKYQSSSRCWFFPNERTDGERASRSEPRPRCNEDVPATCAAHLPTATVWTHARFRLRADMLSDGRPIFGYSRHLKVELMKVLQVPHVRVEYFPDNVGRWICIRGPLVGGQQERLKGRLLTQRLRRFWRLQLRMPPLQDVGSPPIKFSPVPCCPFQLGPLSRTPVSYGVVVCDACIHVFSASGFSHRHFCAFRSAKNSAVQCVRWTRMVPMSCPVVQCAAHLFFVSGAFRAAFFFFLFLWWVSCMVCASLLYHIALLRGCVVVVAFSFSVFFRW